MKLNYMEITWVLYSAFLQFIAGVEKLTYEVLWIN